MAKIKPYSEMSLDELAAARIKLDQQMTAIRAEKKKIQDEVDRRGSTGSQATAHTIADVGGIESEEGVGG